MVILAPLSPGSHRFGDSTWAPRVPHLNPAKIYAGGLAWWTTSEMLRGHFQKFGEISEAAVILDQSSGRSRGFGFITFRDATAAQRAIKDPTPILSGRQIECRIAHQQKLTEVESGKNKEAVSALQNDKAQAPCQAQVLKRSDQDTWCSHLPLNRLGLRAGDSIGTNQFRHLGKKLSRIWSRSVGDLRKSDGKVWQRVGVGDLPSEEPREGEMNPHWREQKRGWQDEDRGQNHGRGFQRQKFGGEGSLSSRAKEQSVAAKLTAAGSSHSGNTQSAQPTPKSDVEAAKRIICYKCGIEGHNSRECKAQVRCDVCCKDTHTTERCVWPRQAKPVMPVVGLAVDDLGFYVAQHAKSNLKRVKKANLGLIKVLEGSVSAEQLAQDFAFHFAWGCEWKATPCGSDFILQFPSKERLQELVNFPELKLKKSGARVEVLPWSSQAKVKARLHTVWVVIENVPDEMLNYQGVCELGSLIGAVEEVDMEALDERDMVRLKVHVMSIEKIPPVLEIAIKPFLYDILFKVESVVEMGWATAESGGIKVDSEADKTVCEEAVQDSGKNKVMEGNSGDTLSIKGLVSKSQNCKDKSAEKSASTLIDSAKVGLSGKAQGFAVNLQPEVVMTDKVLSTQDSPHEDMFLDSQASGAKVDVADSFEEDSESQDPADSLKNDVLQAADGKEDDFQLVKKKKGSKAVINTEATRRSERLGAADDKKIADKATGRAEAKDAFLTKEKEQKKDGGNRKQAPQKGGK